MEAKPALRAKSSTGGFFVGSFKLVKLGSNGIHRFLAEYHFIHQYLYDQDPEKHRFIVGGTKGYAITDIHFGHSYSHLDKDELQDFDKWLTWKGKQTYELKTAPVMIDVDWSGRLPHPEPIDTESFRRPLELLTPGWGLLLDPDPG